MRPMDSAASLPWIAGKVHSRGPRRTPWRLSANLTKYIIDSSEADGIQPGFASPTGEKAALASRRWHTDTGESALLRNLPTRVSTCRTRQGRVPKPGFLRNLRGKADSLDFARWPYNISRVSTSNPVQKSTVLEPAVAVEKSL